MRNVSFSQNFAYWLNDLFNDLHDCHVVKWIPQTLVILRLNQLPCNFWKHVMVVQLIYAPFIKLIPIIVEYSRKYLACIMKIEINENIARWNTRNLVFNSMIKLSQNILSIDIVLIFHSFLAEIWKVIILIKLQKCPSEHATWFGPTYFNMEFSTYVRPRWSLHKELEHW